MVKRAYNHMSKYSTRDDLKGNSGLISPSVRTNYVSPSNELRSPQQHKIANHQQYSERGNRLVEQQGRQFVPLEFRSNMHGCSLVPSKRDPQTNTINSPSKMYSPSNRVQTQEIQRSGNNKHALKAHQHPYFYNKNHPLSRITGTHTHNLNPKLLSVKSQQSIRPVKYGVESSNRLVCTNKLDSIKPQIRRQMTSPVA